jgi:hypothetical protein
MLIDLLLNATKCRVRVCRILCLPSLGPRVVVERVASILHAVRHVLLAILRLIIIVGAAPCLLSWSERVSYITMSCRLEMYRVGVERISTYVLLRPYKSLISETFISRRIVALSLETAKVLICMSLVISAKVIINAHGLQLPLQIGMASSQDSICSSKMCST